MVLSVCYPLPSLLSLSTLLSYSLCPMLSVCDCIPSNFQCTYSADPDHIAMPTKQQRTAYRSLTIASNFDLTAALLTAATLPDRRLYVKVSENEEFGGTVNMVNRLHNKRLSSRNECNRTLLKLLSHSQRCTLFRAWSNVRLWSLKTLLDGTPN